MSNKGSPPRTPINIHINDEGGVEVKNVENSTTEAKGKIKQGYRIYNIL